VKEVIRNGRQEPLLPGRNEAAERLRRAIAGSEGERVLDEALTAEREPLLAALKRLVEALDDLLFEGAIDRVDENGEYELIGGDDPSGSRGRFSVGLQEARTLIEQDGKGATDV